MLFVLVFILESMLTFTLKMCLGTLTALRKVIWTSDGEVHDPTRGPLGEAAKSRRELLDERQRAKVQHKKAAEAARSHFLYNLAGMF